MAKRQEPLKVIRVVLCGGLMPKQSVEYSAGYDLYVPFDTVIKRGRQVVKIGVKIGLPPGIDGHIRPRSGFSVEGMEDIPLQDLSGSNGLICLNQRRSGSMPMSSKVLLTMAIRMR